MKNISSMRQPFPKEFYCQKHSRYISSTTARPNFSSLYDPNSNKSPWVQTCYAEGPKLKIICFTDNKAGSLIKTIAERDNSFQIYIQALEQCYLNGFEILLAIKDAEGAEKLYKVDSWPIPIKILQQVIYVNPKEFSKLAHERDPHCSRDNLYILSADKVADLLLSLGLGPSMQSNNIKLINPTLEAVPSGETIRVLHYVKTKSGEFPELKYLLSQMDKLPYYINLIEVKIELDLDIIEQQELKEIAEKTVHNLPSSCKLIFSFYTNNPMLTISKIESELFSSQKNFIDISYNTNSKEPYGHGDFYKIFPTQTSMSIINESERLWTGVVFTMEESLLNNLSIHSLQNIFVSLGGGNKLNNLQSIDITGLDRSCSVLKNELLTLIECSPNLEYLKLSMIYLHKSLWDGKQLSFKREYINKDEILVFLDRLHTFIIDENLLTQEALNLVKGHTSCRIRIIRTTQTFIPHDANQLIPSIQEAPKESYFDQFKKHSSSWMPLSYTPWLQQEKQSNEPYANYSYVTKISPETVQPDLKFDFRKVPQFDQKFYFVRRPPRPNNEPPKRIRQKVCYLDSNKCEFTPTVYKYINIENIRVSMWVSDTTGEQIFNEYRPYAVLNWNPRIAIKFKAGERVVLYTETPTDELLKFAIDRNVGDVQFKFERGDNDLFYVTASKDIAELNCQFLVATPQKTEKPEIFPIALHNFEQDIKSFSVGEKDLDENKYSSNELKIQEILQSKVGSCRHRVQAFIYQFHQIRHTLPNYEVRMIEGSGHAWFEWRANTNEPFIMRDSLGGYPARSHYHHEPQLSAQPANNMLTFASLMAIPKALLGIWEQSTVSSPSQQQKSTIARNISATSSSSAVSENSAVSRNTTLTLTPKDNIMEFLALDATDDCGYNYFLSFDTTAKQQGFIKALQQQNPRKIFHAYNVKDLGPFVPELMSTQGENQWYFSSKAPGHLQLYLKNLGPDEKPIIVLTLEPSDLVKYNSIIDSEVEKRHINTFKIPENAIIITTTAGDSTVLEDNSILSRQHKWNKVDFTPEYFLLEEKHETPVSLEASRYSLYHSPDWQALLLGYGCYNMEGKAVIFPGYLGNAIAQNLSHLPIHDPEFLLFIDSLMANKGFWFLDQWHSFPYEIILDKSEEYNYRDARDIVNEVNINNLDIDTATKNAHILTAQTFERCLRNIVAKNHLFCQSLGWVEAAKDSELTFLVHEALCAGQWRCLLDECKKYNVRLNLNLAPGVELPSGLKFFLKDRISIIELETPYPSPKIPFESSILLINANAQILEKLGDSVVIDASDLSDEDVLYRYDFSYANEDKPKAECKRSDLLDFLLDGENIVLTGNISLELISHLATLFAEDSYLWIDGKKEEVHGILVLVPENDIYNLPLAKRSRQYDCKTDRQFYPDFCETPSMKLKNEMRLPIQLSSKIEMDGWWTEQEYFDLVAEREHFVLKNLKRAPFLFMEGVAGSGKTTLMLSMRENHKNKALFFYEDELIKWATTTQEDDDKEKILFIDEANLREGQNWTMFEIFKYNFFYKGALYVLTPRHKIVFAGNPLTHGGGRNIPTLFKRHPYNIINCPALPKAYLEHAIIRPIFSYLPKEPGLDPIQEGRNFLKNYNLESGDVRDLQSKAILYVQGKIESNSKEPEEKFIFSEQYVFVHSHERFLEHLKETLKIHQFKRYSKSITENITVLNPACYGGHSGLLIEGAPDTGKTTLLMAGLKAAGYQPGTFAKGPKKTHTEKIYYRMYPGQMERILDTAFQEGAVLVWDEINTYLTPSLNAKLNAYLSGHDMAKNPPRYPGFTLLSSINPAYLQGRVALDNALLSRLKHHKVNKYSAEDFKKILNVYGKNLLEQTRENILEQFLDDRKTAKAEHTPMPGTRDLINKINAEIRSYYKRKPNNTQEIGVGSSSTFFQAQKRDIDPNEVTSPQYFMSIISREAYF